MQNLGDLAAFIAGKIGLSDTASLTKIKSFATQRYASIYAGALWKDALTILTRNVAASEPIVILPAHIAHFVAAKFDATGLIPIDQSFLFASNPTLWEDSGTPTHCSELAPSASKLMPAAAGELLSLRSSQAGDTGLVSLFGEDANGDPQQEIVTLNGTNKVATVNAYAILYTFSKGATQGTITLKDNVGINGTTTYSTLLPTETQRLHRRVRLHQIPSSALTLLILAKRHPGPFTQDTDATNLPTLCDQGLQAMVHGDALEWMQQYGKAQGKFAEGLRLLADAKKSEAYQASQNIRMTPGDGIAEGCSEADFLN